MKKHKRYEKIALLRNINLVFARWTIQNIGIALQSPVECLRSVFAISSIIRTMRTRRDEIDLQFPGEPAIHFVYGFKQTEKFPVYALIAIESARRLHPKSPILFYCLHEPYGKYWEFMKGRLIIVKLPNFSHYGPSQINHYAHKTDVVRLLALRELGGIYLDIDTICVRSFAPLLEHEFVMGVQISSISCVGGLCNATMVSKRNARFVRRWLRYYNGFRSKGRDKLWDFHSVKLPWLLQIEFPADIKVLTFYSFFFPLWSRVKEAMFTPGSASENIELFAESYSVHLWNNFTGEFLDSLEASDLSDHKDWLYTQFAGVELVDKLVRGEASDAPSSVKAIQRLPSNARGEFVC